jgi:hypothetical protein
LRNRCRRTHRAYRMVGSFICHPSDSRVNAVNQRYWLQYHTSSELLSPLSSTETHLIKPSDTSVDYAHRHKLRPFCKWLNLTHLDTFVHGPFEFATVHGQKTRDHISQVDWDVLKSHLDMFHNPIPPFDVLTYSIHIDRFAHVQFHDATISCQLILAASADKPAPGMPTPQCQKVPVFIASTPIFSSASSRYDVLGRPTFVIWQESQLKYPFGNMVSLFGVPLWHSPPCL